MQENRHLTSHFTLYQLTATNHADLQEENRHITQEEGEKLVRVAHMLELCRTILKCELDVHSGRRYLELNKRVGGSERSQHLKCEAADFSPAGPDTEETINGAFNLLIAAAKQPNSVLNFGQLIVESESRAGGREGRKYWLHISLGAPYRDPARCGECLSIKIVDGKKTTVVVDKIV